VSKTGAETINVRAGEELPLAAVERTLRKRVLDLPEGELEVRQFPSGASNLTYLLKIGGWEAVLRRPPLGPLPPKAHDMSREFRILSRLNPAFPLAPRPYFFCDESLIGAPFYVMERRRGVVVDRSFPKDVEPSPELCRRLSETVVDTWVDLHAVDYDVAGLGDLGRPEGFLERQVRGWTMRYEKAKTEEVEEVKLLTRWLDENIPDSPPPSVVHNDYKLNNLILAPEDLAEVRAVLDWEMASIGDPLLDLGNSLAYWIEACDPQDLKEVMPTVTDAPGFMTRRELMERYAHRSGRDLSKVRFYVTFGYFRLAVALQQIYARWKRGQTKDERFADFGKKVHTLVLHASELAASGRI
jgi:aminoglycoside phosphotransferase (APT) family kinase protein